MIYDTFDGRFRFLFSHSRSGVRRAWATPVAFIFSVPIHRVEPKKLTKEKKKRADEFLGVA